MYSRELDPWAKNEAPWAKTPKPQNPKTPCDVLNVIELLLSNSYNSYLVDLKFIMPYLLFILFRNHRHYQNLQCCSIIREI